jgi:hypothetical protein
VQTFTGTGAAYYPKAKITNSATGDVYTVPITLDQAAFMLDIVTCLPAKYYQTSDVAGTTGIANGWAADTTLLGNMIVDMASGNGLLWVGVQFPKADASGAYDNYDPIYYHIESAKFTVTGFKFDNTTSVISDVKVVFWPWP